MAPVRPQGEAGAGASSAKAAVAANTPAKLTAPKSILVEFLISSPLRCQARSAHASGDPRIAMTVLFRRPNLNMALCLFGPVLGKNGVIWASVVAMQQLVA